MTGPKEVGRFSEGAYFKLPGHCCRFFLVIRIYSDSEDNQRADMLVRWGLQDNDDWRWEHPECHDYERIQLSGKLYSHAREMSPFGDEKEV